MQKYNILELNEKLLPELQSIAEELGIKKISSLKKEELVYRILDEQAISYAGLQAEKEKEKEAKKAEKQTKAKKPSKTAVAKAPKTENKLKAAKSETAAVVAPEATQPAEEKKVAVAAEKKEQPERKKRVRIEKKEKVAGAVVPANQTDDVKVTKTPQTVSTEVAVEKPLLPPVVVEGAPEELPAVEVVPEIPVVPVQKTAEVPAVETPAANLKELYSDTLTPSRFLINFSRSLLHLLNRKKQLRNNLNSRMPRSNSNSCKMLPVRIITDRTTRIITIISATILMHRKTSSTNLMEF